MTCRQEGIGILFPDSKCRRWSSFILSGFVGGEREAIGASRTGQRLLKGEGQKREAPGSGLTQRASWFDRELLIYLY